MADGFLRYYKRERITLDCEVVTPMFLGGADQSAQWRAAPFKALLRKWWRVTQWAVDSWEDLRASEGRLFGTAGEEESGKSKIGVVISASANSSSKTIAKGRTLEHPECEKTKCQVSALPYLGGMGIMTPNGDVRHSYFSPGTDFKVEIYCPASFQGQIGPVIRLLKPFGSIGARSRNGWGSFRFSSPNEITGAFMVKPWATAFNRDYPCLVGRDERGPLVWQTAERMRWEDAMSDLAEVYIGVRARKIGDDLKLNPGSGTASERHLLGIPLTNHKTKYGNTARHASPLHFKVMKKSKDSYLGIIVYLPHAHSKEQPFMDVEPQKEVWRTVHRKLDGQPKIIKRANLKELLA